LFRLFRLVGLFRPVGLERVVRSTGPVRSRPWAGRVVGRLRHGQPLVVHQAARRYVMLTGGR
jgi:hypothetical protein